MTIPVWKKRENRNEFFKELEALLDKYDDLSTLMSRSYEDDPHDCEPDDDCPPYDPNTPVVLTGMFLIVSYSNMDGYESICHVWPEGQSQFLNRGLVRITEKDMGKGGE